MPAPIVPAAPPALASAPSGAVSALPAGDADAVSFDSVLAAALADPIAADPDPPAWTSLGEDAPKPEDPAADDARAVEFLPEALEAAWAAAAPPQAAVPAPLTPGPRAVPLQISQASTPPLAAPDSAALLASPRIEPVGKVSPAGKVSIAEPEQPLPEAARIAAPAGDAALRQSAELPAAQSLVAQPSAGRDVPLGDSRPGSADAGVTLMPMATEHAENTTRAPAQAVRLDVAAAVGSREFGTEVGNRLVWMATHNHQVAELRVDPPHLGPVEMRLSIANDQATLSIVSPHAAVRDAIQASLPRLQDMLQGLGINLGNVSVGAEGFGQSHFAHTGPGHDWGQGAEYGLSGAAYSPQGAVAAATLPLRADLGMIDVYA